MMPDNQSVIESNEYNYDWTVQINRKNKQLTSNLFEIKSSPGLNFCMTAEINNNSNLIKVKIIKTFTKLAIATIELKIADIPPIIKDISEWKDVIIFDKIPIPSGCDDCQKNTWNLCILTTPDSHEYRIKISCSIIWYGFVDELLAPKIFEDMQRYLNTLDFSDIIIKVDDTEFHAHKIVLASQSPVFADMIATSESNGSSKEQFIDLQDVDVNVVYEMLTFLYYGKLEKAHYDYRIALKLFEAAANTRITKLKDVCGVILSNKLALENVLSLLELARKYNSLILRQRAMTFIINNRKQLFL
ncbi:protein maternal effect lethal 26 [Microplitis demolitor]|uniref:protein maternal effect lethal 26 n=1 Tax=Microplitis demolitor TaxID=69319 RepID=UPI0006D4FD6D|nr:protein maternal effect lethal 26 [Microplitis demolitor]